MLAEAYRLADWISLRHDLYNVYKLSIGPIQLNLWVPKSTPFNDLTIPFVNSNRVDHKSAGINIYCISGDMGKNLFRLVMSSDVPSLRDQAKSGNGLMVSLDPDRGLLKLYDAKSSMGCFFVDDFQSFPVWERFSPLREFLHFLALDRQCLLLHGAAFLNQSPFGTLVVGPGGTGKSTLTVQAFIKGMKVAGDDYVLLELTEDDKVIAHPIYKTLKLHPSSPAFAELATVFQPWSEDNKTEKQVFLIDQFNPESNCFCSFQITTMQVLRPCWYENLAYMAQNNLSGFIMSSVGQMPIAIPQTMKLAKKLYELLYTYKSIGNARDD